MNIIRPNSVRVVCRAIVYHNEFKRPVGLTDHTFDGLRRYYSPLNTGIITLTRVRFSLIDNDIMPESFS
jgi:hypothetical protein